MTTETQYMSKTAVSPEQIVALTQELERQSKTKRDIVVPGKDFRLAASQYDAAGERRDNKQVVGVIDAGDLVGPVRYDVGRIAHEQISEKAGIPRAYYNRMLEQAPALLTENVNHWISDTNGKNHLVRILDDRVRAFLSDRFRVLDNVDLCFEALKVARELGLVPTRADLTDSRFYLRLLAPDFTERVTFRNGGMTRNDGDDLIPGIVVSNSEVGRGGLDVAPFIFNGRCGNGTWYETKLHLVHLGRTLDVGYLTSETLAAEDTAIWMKVHDLIVATFDKEQFAKMVAQMQNAAEQTLDEPTAAVDAVVKHYGLNDETKQSILNELISPKSRDNDPGRTVYGLLQAITAQSHRHENYDDAREYEKIGGDFLGRAEQLVKVR